MCCHVPDLHHLVSSTRGQPAPVEKVPLKLSVTSPGGKETLSCTSSLNAPPHPYTTPVLWVPVTAEDRPIVGCEHPFTSIRSADVPELDVAILKGGGKGKVVSDTELHIPNTLRLACGHASVEA